MFSMASRPSAWKWCTTMSSVTPSSSVVRLVSRISTSNSFLSAILHLLQLRHMDRTCEVVHEDVLSPHAASSMTVVEHRAFAALGYRGIAAGFGYFLHVPHPTSFSGMRRVGRS